LAKNDTRDTSLAQQLNVEAITAQAVVDNNAVQAAAAVANAAAAAATLAAVAQGSQLGQPSLHYHLLCSLHPMHC
jgi:hypothetical protein